MNSLQIKTQILEAGFFVETNTSAYDDFVGVVNALGTARGWTDVRVDPHARSLVKTEKAMALHNDCLFKGFIAWFCVTQDHESGQTVLIDTSDLSSFLNDTEIKDLENIYVHINGEGLTPIYRNNKFYYVPWALVRPTSPRLEATLLKLENYFEHKLTTAPIVVRLEPGQFLIIDDSRMLHGRLGLSKDSGRLLKRAWIEVA